MAIAARRSVSFTRQLAMLRSRLVPSANSAATASVMAASGMWFRSRSKARESSVRAAPRFDPVVAHFNARTHPRQRIGEAAHRPGCCRGPRLRRGPAHRRWHRRPENTRRWTHRPSTKMSPGLTSVALAGIVNDDQPSRSTLTPKRAIRLSVMSIYGLEISSPFTSMVMRRAGQRQRHQQRGQELAGHITAHADFGRAAAHRRAGFPAADSRHCRDSGCLHPDCATHPPDRRSDARACAARRRACSGRRIIANAAVSGRNAVPALPRNKSACLDGKRAIAALDRHHFPPGSNLYAQAGPALRACARRRPMPADRECRVRPRPAPPAAACGWKCSSSRAGARCLPARSSGPRVEVVG